MKVARKASRRQKVAAFRPPLIRLYKDEVVVDNFAGGGGASTGMEMALGRSPDIAINHDKEALAMHRVNHPTTDHVREDVFKVDPVKVLNGRRVGVAWFSPDCTFFSKAKGGAPFRDPRKARRVRGLIGVALKWFSKPESRPRIAIIENVEEIEQWCRIGQDGRPDKRYLGEHWRRFVKRVKSYGGVIEWRRLRGCDFGAPTTRRRLFIIIRFDGQPIVWPEPTHGPDCALKYRTAAECIDFSLPVPSIFLTKKEAKAWGKAHGMPSPKRPLVDKSLRRVARGVFKFVIDSPEPFIVPVRHGGDDRSFRSTRRPLPTIPASDRELAIVEPVLAPFIAKHFGDRVGSSAKAPLDTVMANGAHHAVVQPVLAPFITEHANGSSDRNMPADDPLRTHCANVKGGHFAAVTPVLAPLLMLNSEQRGDRVYSGKEPIRTLTAANARTYQLVVPSLVRTAHGERDKRGKKRGRGEHSAQEPIPTVLTSNDFALMAPVLVNTRNGERKGQAPRIHDTRKPWGTVTAAGSQGAVAAAFLAKHNGGHEATGQKLGRSVDAITTKDQKALVTSHLLKLYGTCQDGQPSTDPAPVVTAHGNHIAEVRTTLGDLETDLSIEQLRNAHHVACFLLKFYGTAKTGQSLWGPMHVVTTKERFALVVVTIAGDDYVIVDIGMRMLTPRELFRAQGFPDRYSIDHGIDVDTNEVIKFSKKTMTRLCGNSVNPQVPAAILAANCPLVETGSLYEATA